MINTISQNGIDFIKELEGGLRLKAYADSKGLTTIGYGHLVNDEFDKFDINKPITEEFAEELLKFDLNNALEVVQRCKIPSDLNQNQFDAFVALAFNVQPQQLLNSQTLKALKAKDWKKMVLEWIGFNKLTIDGKKQISNGLTNRRAKELGLFFS